MARSDTFAWPQGTARPRQLIDPAQSSYKWWVAGTVTLGSFLVNMSQTAVQVALPQMMTAFGFNLAQVQWVIIAYGIAAAILVSMIGWLGNRLGNRTLYVLCLLIFITASVLCGLSWNGTSLIVFRILQGCGGGPISPMTMVFLSSVFPAEQRGLAIGLYGLGATFGPVVGPVIGGYLIEYLNWRIVFFLNIIPGLISVVLVLLILPNTREDENQPLDLAGLLTMGVFFVSLLVALSQGQREGWDSALIQRLLIIAAVAFVAFVMCELSTENPLVDLRLYTNVTFSTASIVVLIFFISFMGSNFLQIILIQRLLNYTPAQAGLVFLPGALLLSLSFPFAGRLADKFDRRIIVLCALGVFALASYLFTFLSPERPLSWIIGLVVLRYGCSGFIFAPMASVALLHLPPEKVRMGSGLLNLMQNGLGNMLGIAIATTLFQQRLVYHREILGQQQMASALAWNDILSPIREFVLQAGSFGDLATTQALALLRRHLDLQATVAAYQDYFMVVTFLCLASMPLVLWLNKPAYPQYRSKCSVSQMPIGLPSPKNRAAVGHAAPTNPVDNCGAQH